MEHEKINYTAEEIRGLRGTEFTYVFTETNGKDLCGMKTKAYVAQADIDKGITIMGFIPKELDYESLGLDDDYVKEEKILSCCNSSGRTNHPEYVWSVNEYVRMILAGEFSPISYDNNKGNSSSDLTDSCAFIND